MLLNSIYFTPTNLHEEEVKFFTDPQYEPQFVYPPLVIEDLKRALEAIQTTPLSADRIAIRRQQETELKLKLFLARGTTNLSTASAALYNINYKYIETAKKDCLLPGKFVPQETTTPDEAALAVTNYLINNGLNDWTVEVTKQHDFYFQVMAKNKKILVSEVVNWDFCDLDNALAHEIDGHVFRAVNMQSQTDPIYQKPLPFYIKTEEGLASFLCDYLSTTAELGRKHHALKYLAGKFALTHTFRETFNFLINGGFTPAIAFRRTFRLKRGIENGEMPGCFAKEAMYYEGMMEVKQYIDAGGDIKKIFAGKIGLADLAEVPIPENIKIPERIYRYQPHSLNP